MEKQALRALQEIPGVGLSLAQDLYDLGMRQVDDLSRQNPEFLYERLCVMRGQHIDRCVLYVFRCAVYYASGGDHDPRLLMWWHWKDKPERKRPR